MSRSASNANKNANRSEFDKRAEHKRKEKEKAFESLISLPNEQQETRLAELAKRLDEDVAAIRADFTAFVGMESRAVSTDAWNIELWPEPVETRALLQKISAKISKYIVLRPVVTLNLLCVMLLGFFTASVRTGSYKGLFQLSDHEFNKYGDGSIWDARDNARAAAHMFLVQAEKFRWALGGRERLLRRNLERAGFARAA